MNTNDHNVTGLENKLAGHIRNLQAIYEKGGENYREECECVFEMHKEAKKEDDLDGLWPILRDRFNIRKSTARKMRKMHEFWGRQSEEANEVFPKLFSKLGRTKLELLCCLKMEKDADKPSGYKKKKFLRFHDLIIDGEFAKVELVNPDQSILAHEYSERDLKRILSSSEAESDDTQAESVEAADSPGADAPSSQESEELHPKYKTYPALKKAYEDLEAKLVQKEKLIEDLLAERDESQKETGAHLMEVSETKEEAEAERDNEQEPGFNDIDDQSEATFDSAVEQHNAIEEEEDAADQVDDDFEIEDITLEEETVIPVERADTKPGRQPAYSNRSRTLAGTPNTPSQTAINRENSSCTHA